MSDEYSRGCMISTGSVVHVMDSDKGLQLHFVNPLLAPNDPPCAKEWDDDGGRHVLVGISEEAARHLLYLLMERLGIKNNGGGHGG